MSTDMRGDGDRHGEGRDDERADASADGSADQSVDVVSLDLPLHHRHASTVRVVAASLAADLGFSVDEIEDLRLGVDEAVSVIADVDAGPDARLHLRFVSSDRTITVHASRSNVERSISPDDVDELAVRILRAVVDRFEVTGDSFVVSKRASSAHGD